MEVKQHEMGPNSVWLMEYLTSGITIQEGMRVLDLGCGKAMSSIFLAKEFGVQVWACDLWISPTDNYKTVIESGVADRVFPLNSEARHLPFPTSFFDIIVSVDAYHYFGTGETFLPYILGYLKKDGFIGIVSPGLCEETITHHPPEKLKEFWIPEFFTFHSLEWWRNHWEKTGFVEIICADVLENGWHDWLTWEEELLKTNPQQVEARGSDRELLQADGGEYLCFPRLVARKV
jgi:cyclopropane fatty-acyl-phospholipid synthase-like methyltransferase